MGIWKQSNVYSSEVSVGPDHPDPFPRKANRFSARKILLDRDPFDELDDSRDWLTRGVWPAMWITLPDSAPPSVAAFRCLFAVDDPRTIQLHVTASERYQLLCDGQVIGEGPERSDPSSWAFDTYELSVAAGKHTLVVLTWALAGVAPRWQVGSGMGLLLAAADQDMTEILNTGIATWQGMEIEGFAFTPPFDNDFFSIGWDIHVDGRQFPWGFERGDGDWGPVAVGSAGSTAGARTRVPTNELLLRPAQVPSMRRTKYEDLTVRQVDDRDISDPFKAAERLDGEQLRWQRAIAGGMVTVPPRRRVRVLLDTSAYIVGRLRIVVSGGSGTRIRIRWAEALVDAHGDKGHRDHVEGRHFLGVGDEFVADGGDDRTFELPMLIRAGRYLLIQVETRDQELLVHNIVATEIGYPVQPDGICITDNAQFNGLLALCARTIDASSQDTFTDGPYYEQMMWAGDGIQNSLVTYARCHDDTLVRRWLTLLDQSRDASGLPCARWPARDRLVIVPYAFYWIQGVRDFAMWRNDMAFVRGLMPGVRSALDAVERFVTETGLLGPLPGWSFVDWVPEWTAGVPVGAETEAHAIINWHWAAALTHASELELILGEHERAARYRRVAKTVATRLMATLWDPHRRAFLDTASSHSVSEHAQVFAVLSGRLDSSTIGAIRSSLVGGALTPVTPQFGHHAIEAFRRVNWNEGVWAMIKGWYPVLERGFRTLPETPEPTRSDCHGWSAHPLFHGAATIAGVRPTAPGFATVSVTPNLGDLEWIQATLPHPKGEIVVELERHGSTVRGEVILPNNVTGSFGAEAAITPIGPGRQTVHATHSADPPE